MNELIYVKVKIVGIVSENDDSIRVVEVELMDYENNIYRLYDKEPIFTTETINTFPSQGLIRCLLVEKREEYLKVNTYYPDFLESENGEREFYILKNQVISKEE